MHLNSSLIYIYIYIYTLWLRFVHKHLNHYIYMYMGHIHPIKALDTYIWVPYICIHLQPLLSYAHALLILYYTILGML